MNVQHFERNPVGDERRVAQPGQHFFGLMKRQKGDAHEKRVQPNGDDACKKCRVADPISGQHVPDDEGVVAVAEQEFFGGRFPVFRYFSLDQQQWNPPDEHQQRCGNWRKADGKQDSAQGRKPQPAQSFRMAGVLFPKNQDDGCPGGREKEEREMPP